MGLDMPSKMVIGVDIDGVLANFVAGFRPLVRIMYGTDPGPATSWTWYRSVVKSDEDNTRLWEWLWENTWFWRRLVPLPGAEDALLRLRAAIRAGHLVYFITHRPQAAHGATVGWLMDYGIAHPQVILGKNKRAICEAIGVTHYIDDYEENVQKFTDGTLSPVAAVLCSAEHNARSSMSSLSLAFWLSRLGL